MAPTKAGTQARQPLRIFGIMVQPKDNQVLAMACCNPDNQRSTA
jgi:hypothetical protein